MFDSICMKQVEVLEHRGYKICLTDAAVEWMAAVALAKQCPTLIMVPDPEAAIAKAHDWIERQHACVNNHK
jgi:hypothetical protein